MGEQKSYIIRNYYEETFLAKVVGLKNALKVACVNFKHLRIVSIYDEKGDRLHVIINDPDEKGVK